MREYALGDTVVFTWVNSGVSMSPFLAVYDGNETLVNSITMTSSGNGHYFGLYTTTSLGYYVGKMQGTLNAKPYVRPRRFKVVGGGTD